MQSSGKNAVVRRLRSEGRVVAMESAGVTLVKGDLAGIARAGAQSRHHAQYPGEPGARLRLQRTRDPDCRILHLLVRHSSHTGFEIGSYSL